MEFHPDKCQIIPITHNKKPVHNKYTLNGHVLQTTQNAKYLGLTVTSNLSWNTHIDNITCKANKTLGFVRRNIKVSSPKIKSLAYFSLVRPILEYSSSVWDPYTQVKIDQIEMVQRRAARYVTNRHHNTSSVTDMLNHLGWRPLALRRTDARLCMMYKIVHCLVAIPSEKYFIPITRPSRHHHNLSFQTPSSKTDYHMYSFFPRTTRAWNALPLDTVNLLSLDLFRSQVQTMQHKEMIYTA